MFFLGKLHTQFGSLLAGPLADAFFKHKLKKLIISFLALAWVGIAVFVLTLPPMGLPPIVPPLLLIRVGVISFVGFGCGVALPGGCPITVRIGFRGSVFL